MDVAVENLSKSFGTQKAVDSVSFSVKKGEILGLLGPNGAGKTTIMKIITCFLFPDQGNVYIGNYSIRKHAYRLKQLIGYLPEHNPLYDEMNVIDFLTFIANIHNIPRYKITSRVLDMLKICGLEYEKHKNIRELSKGYKQRVGLAQTLIHDPEIVILDEPTTGLDPNQIVEIRELIKNTGKEKTVILSSHILAEIEATCDRVLIINKGKIVANGTAAELRKSNKEKLLKINIEGGETNRIFNELSLINEVDNINILGENHFELQSTQDNNIEKEIFDICTRNQWYIKELIPIERRLEDIFRQVTQN
ncbi:ATP-binding cassette domain-containing protein [Odoribacter lunatus]|uniref:ATP-binding cassette domain-containing protein n=1 Tax=Odoribacter lunatus TaxID=2941335 RepID=UPI00203D1AF7|nr:ATP-binding cassette domain-containing protein [Odoribacter lunatus]